MKSTSRRGSYPSKSRYPRLRVGHEHLQGSVKYERVKKSIRSPPPISKLRTFFKNRSHVITSSNPKQKVFSVKYSHSERYLGTIYSRCRYIIACCNLAVQPGTIHVCELKFGIETGNFQIPITRL